MTELVRVPDDDLRLALGYLRNLAKQFTNIPKGLDPTFYHTLSYESEVAEGERLLGVIERLEDRRWREAK